MFGIFGGRDEGPPTITDKREIETALSHLQKGDTLEFSIRAKPRETVTVSSVDDTYVRLEDGRLIEVELGCISHRDNVNTMVGITKIYPDEELLDSLEHER